MDAPRALTRVDAFYTRRKPMPLHSLAKTSLATTLLAAGLIAGSAPAFADQTKVGVLRCNVSSGLGLVVTSSRSMACLFTPVRGRPERYSGLIQKFGLDIGATKGGVLAWDVFAPSTGPSRGALAGDYAGVDASATVGAGLGANALVGGFGRSVALQPLSIEVQSGLALAAGVASMTLRPAG
jgi:hypothetical protein